MKTLFDPTDGAQAAGLNVIRVPIGASDYSTMGLSFLDLDARFARSSFPSQTTVSMIQAAILRYLTSASVPYPPTHGPCFQISQQSTST